MWHTKGNQQLFGGSSDPMFASPTHKPDPNCKQSRPRKHTCSLGGRMWHTTVTGISLTVPVADPGLDFVESARSEALPKAPEPEPTSWSEPSSVALGVGSWALDLLRRCPIGAGSDARDLLRMWLPALAGGFVAPRPPRIPRGLKPEVLPAVGWMDSSVGKTQREEVRTLFERAMQGRWQ